MPSNNSINNTITSANFTVPAGSITSSGNILSTAGTVTGIIGVGVGAAPVTSALYINASNRIGAWITGTNVSTAGVDADGLFIDTSFAPTLNIGNAASIGLYPTFNPPGGVTITTGYGLYIASGTQGGAGAVTTGYGLFVTHPTFGTTNYAAQIDNMRLDVNSIVATNANGSLTINSDGSGALNLNTTNATGAVNIGTGTSGRTINVGLSAANNLVFIGTANGTSATNIQSGSGNLILNSTGGTASLDATSGVSINSTAGALNLGNGANAFAVNIGTGAAVRPVTVGSTTAGSTTVIQAPTAGMTLTGVQGVAVANKNYVTINTATGAIGSDAGAASSISITGDTGGALSGNAFTFTGGTTGLSFGGSGSTETLTFAGITANGGTVSLATDATTSTINVGTGAGVKTSTFGSTNSTSATTVQSGSGALDITATGGALTINSGTGVLGISTDASATTISIGTGGAVKGITLGSTNSTSNTVIQAGTGASSFQPTGAGSLALGSTNTGTTTLGNLTGTTTINFGGGSALTTYVAQTSFTPTFVGTVAGVTTYGTQSGYYVRIGSLVHVFAIVTWTAATGTGDALLGGLPFTINGSANYNPTGSCVFSATWTWPAAGTSMILRGLGGTTTAKFQTTGSATAIANLQMTNAAGSLVADLTYFI